jgi:hypothetical protein
MKKTNNTAAQALTEIQAATQRMKDLRAALKFATPLSPSERREVIKRTSRGRGLNTLESRLAAASQHRDLLPPAFDLRQFEADTAQTRALEQCLLAASDVQQAVRDTYLTVSGRALRSAKLAYEHLRVSLAGSDQLKRDVGTMTLRVSRSPRRDLATVPDAAKPNAAAPAGASDSTAPPGSPPASAAEPKKAA